MPDWKNWKIIIIIDLFLTSGSNISLYLLLFFSIGVFVVTAGFVIAFLTYEMDIIAPAYYSWRILFWFMAVVGFAIWAVRTRLKESPRWLEVHGEYKKANEITTEWEQKTMERKHLKELPEEECSSYNSSTKAVCNSQYRYNQC